VCSGRPDHPVRAVLVLHDLLGHYFFPFFGGTTLAKAKAQVRVIEQVDKKKK
jgi:hypothetical protein